MRYRDVVYWYNVDQANGADPDREEFELVDLRDGQGPRIGRWNEAALGTAPTPAQIDALDTATVDAWWTAKRDAERANADQWSDAERVLAKICFAQENRIRDLERRPNVTWAQFKARIKQEL